VRTEPTVVTVTLVIKCRSHGLGDLLNSTVKTWGGKSLGEQLPIGGPGFNVAFSFIGGGGELYGIMHFGSRQSTYRGGGRSASANAAKEEVKEEGGNSLEIVTKSPLRDHIDKLKKFFKNREAGKGENAAQGIMGGERVASPHLGNLTLGGT